MRFSQPLSSTQNKLEGKGWGRPGPAQGRLASWGLDSASRLLNDTHAGSLFLVLLAHPQPHQGVGGWGDKTACVPRGGAGRRWHHGRRLRIRAVPEAAGVGGRGLWELLAFLALKFTHVVAGARMSFLLQTGCYSSVRVDPVCTPIPLQGGPGVVFTLELVRIMPTWVYKYLFNSLLLFFRVSTQSGISRAQGDSMFNLLRNHHATSHSGCPILRPHQPCTKFPVSPPPCQHLLVRFLF